MTDKGMTRRHFIRNSLVSALAVAPISLAGGCAGAKVDLTSELAKIDRKQDPLATMRSYMDAYDFDNCIECGECLRGCIYKDLSEEQAIENIVKMREGDVDVCEEMLDQCTLCYKCDHRCPVDARPAALMLERLRDRRNRENGVSLSMRYFINGMESKGWDQNMFRDLYTDHNEEEQKILEKWSTPKDCGDGDLLWCSCAVRIFPYDIEHSQVLADLQKFGGISDCCGLPAFRSGLYDVSRYLTNNLIDRLSECRFKRLVVMCGSCQEMFTLATPTYFGQEFPFEVISVYQYIEEQMQKGKASIKRQVPDEIKKDACISHSCFGCEFEADYMASIESLYRQVGFDCVELAHKGENNACCGMGGYYRKGSLWDILDVRNVKKKDIEKSEKEHIVSYCYGCYFISDLFQGGTSHYLLEKLLWALGDEIKYPMSGLLGRSLNLSNMLHMMKIGPSVLF